MENIIGARIKYLRITNGMLQKELAEKINVSNNTLSSYEHGVRIPGDEVKLKIANLFGVSVDYLLGKTNDPGESVDSEIGTSFAAPSVVNQMALLAASNTSAAEIMAALPNLSEAQLNRVIGYIQALQNLPADDSDVPILEKRA